MIVLTDNVENVVCIHYSAVRMQKAVSAYFTRMQILPYTFADQYYWQGKESSRTDIGKTVN